jgi:hypothetical protein
MGSGQRHSVEARRGWDGKSRAWWSLRPAGRLLLFVHGLGGAATASWRYFPQLLLDDNDFGGWDFFFYEFDSPRQPAEESAQALYLFLRRMLTDGVYANPDLPADRARPESFAYQEIWLVTHGFGAPVARAAALSALAGGDAWYRQLRLICFAPATRGTRKERLAALAEAWTGRLGPLVPAVVRRALAGIDDASSGSGFLRRVLGETEAAVRMGYTRPAISDLTVFGQGENVVLYPPEFPFDTPIPDLPNRDHYSICKPSPGADEPYRLLKQTVGQP